VTVMGYMTALLVGFTLGGARDRDVSGPSDVILIVILSTIFGVVLGRTLFRAPSDAESR